MFSTIVLVLVLAVPSTASAQDAPTRDQLTALVTASTGGDFASFDDFLDQLAAQDAVPGLTQAREAQAAGALEPAQLKLLARLLGVYNRISNEAQALEALAELIAVETYASPDYPEQHDNPAFIEMGERIAALAEAFGMSYRNLEGRIFEVVLEGASDEVFGVLTHSDVVPVQSRNWTTEEGVEVDPFVMQVIDNRIYGRGAIDDKGSIATALFAMKAAKESGLPLKRDIRLMIETTEETSGSGMEYYLENETAPDYNIVLDSDYPAVTAEKGYGTISANFPVVQAEGGKAVITGIVGSAAANQIPERAVTTIAATDAEAVAAALNETAPTFVSEHGGDFTVEAIPGDGSVELVVTGTSAHASEPERGVNPVPRLAAFIGASDVDFVDNHYFQALRYIDEAYGLDYLGEKLGVAYADDFMGPLTLSPTYFNEVDGTLTMAVNVRAPRHAEKDVAGVQGDIEGALETWKRTANSPVSFDITVNDWMFRDPNGAWLNLLLEIYGDTTGELAEPISSAGSTTAKLLPNAVNFGPNMPSDKYMGHTENEFKRLDVFRLDLQMFTEMMVRMSNLPAMQ
jgi:predicted dipeptidase